MFVKSRVAWENDKNSLMRVPKSHPGEHYEEVKRTLGSPQVSKFQKAGNALESFSRTNRGSGVTALLIFWLNISILRVGAVVADQQFLADKMGVNRSTIIRWLNYLESKNALVRIIVAGKVCAYALDPMKFEGL